MRFQGRVKFIRLLISELTVEQLEGLTDELDGQRGTEKWDDDASPVVAVALADELRDRYTAADTRTDAERIEYIRTMPNTQPRLVQRCLTAAIFNALEKRHPGVAVRVYDDWEAQQKPTDPEGETWPAFLAARYAEVAAAEVSS